MSMQPAIGAALWNPTLNQWEYRTPYQRIKVKATRIIVQGPTVASVIVNCTLNIYLDNTFYDTTPNGGQNSNDLSNPIVIPAGQQLRLVWNYNSSAVQLAPQATVYLEEA